MPGKIQQPSNPVKLTNVSVIRLKRGGKRFEIACYKGKAQEWRSGLEKNIDNVLQISSVFLNVSKGEVATQGDLQNAFGKTDAVKEILEKGEIQIGDKERVHDLGSLRREIATRVAEKTVDPSTQVAYPVGMIEAAMTEVRYSVNAHKNAKSQVSECIKLLQSHSKLPLQRARMRVKISLPPADAEKLRTQILEGADSIESNETAESGWEVTMLIDPKQYRVLIELLEKEGNGRMETLSVAATVGGDRIA